MRELTEEEAEREGWPKVRQVAMVISPPDGLIRVHPHDCTCYWCNRTD